MAAPLFAPAETWGESIHFEIPVETGRDRTARVNGLAGELYFWSEDDRVIFAFGPTPISRPNEMRLPRPCNVWARAWEKYGGVFYTLSKTVFFWHTVSFCLCIFAEGER